MIEGVADDVKERVGELVGQDLVDLRLHAVDDEIGLLAERRRSSSECAAEAGRQRFHRHEPEGEGGRPERRDEPVELREGALRLVAGAPVRGPRQGATERTAERAASECEVSREVDESGDLLQWNAYDAPGHLRRRFGSALRGRGNLGPGRGAPRPGRC